MIFFYFCPLARGFLSFCTAFFRLFASERQKDEMALTSHKSYKILVQHFSSINVQKPGLVAQSVEHLTRKSGVLGSIPGLAKYFRFSFRFFKKGSCKLLAKVCARSTC